MGNNHSQDTTVPSAIASHLSNKAKTKLSEQKPGLKHLFLPSSIHTKKNGESSPSPLPRTSSSSSCTPIEYITLNGRRYINKSEYKYLLPCDEDESDRLIVLHYLLKDAFGTNFISPVTSLLKGTIDQVERPKVLDIGTGAGTWILELATEYTEADFYGIDIATMYPTTIKPGNANFQQHDILKLSLPFDDESFDFIYMRQMMTSLTKSQLVRFLTEITRVLKPNGYLEIVDVECQIQRAGPATSSLINTLLQEQITTFGTEFDLCTQLSTLLMTTQTTQGGFMDTMQHRVTMPLGWGGPLGDLHARNLELYLKSIHPSTTRSTEQEPLLCDTAIQTTLMECKQYHSHLNWFTCTARKSPSSPLKQLGQGSDCSLPQLVDKVAAPTTLSSPPTPPLDPLEWESINSFVTGYVE
ncbi:S-adenosyl-L-methionine-dependent methyltransferase [Chlamydoabsidia padenii]|nr:S-adenosyl-L-methionine-dependent methyltransferase [Chlamydoabsidia padenii]